MNRQFLENRYSVKALLFLALALASPNMFAEGVSTIRILCEYTHTVTDEGDQPTSGEDLFVVQYTADGTAGIIKSGLGATFMGKVTEYEIRGEVEYTLADTTIKETLLINRYSGALTLSIDYKRSSGQLIHFGKCRAANDRLF